MALTVHKYPDLSGVLWHYNNTVKLRFSKKHWLYLMEGDDGSLTPINGVTGTLKQAIDKSPQLIGWATRLFMEKAIALVQECRRGEFVEIVYDDLVAILEQARYEHKNVLEAAGETGHDAHNFVESLVKATMVDDEMRRLEVLAKFPEDDRASNAAVAAVAFLVDHNVRFNAAEQRVFSLEWLTCGTMDGDCWMDSCSNPDCPCQRFAPFTDKRMVLDWKTSNQLQSSYEAQVDFYWKAKVEEFPEVKFDGSVIIRLGKDDKSDFECHVRMGDEAHEKGLLFFKRALDLCASIKASEESMREVKDLQRAKAKAAKDAALRIRCPKADKYKGSRKTTCFEDGTQCDACRKIYENKQLTY